MINKVHTDCIDNMTSLIEAQGDSGMPNAFPVHPCTQKCLQEYGLLERMPGNVGLIKPLGYLDMANVREILTDGVFRRRRTCRECHALR